MFRILKRVRDIFQGEHKASRIFIALSTAVFIFIWVVGPGNTVIHWMKAKMDIKAQKRAIEQYNAEIEEMNKRINMLKTDKDTLEKFAREHFYFAAPGEDVYVIE
jgi:cell division protein FtsB